MMLKERQRRNYAETAIDCYVRAVEDFSRHFNFSADLQATSGSGAPQKATIWLHFLRGEHISGLNGSRLVSRFERGCRKRLFG